jgi:hypothetical protein
MPAQLDLLGQQSLSRIGVRLAFRRKGGATPCGQFSGGYQAVVAQVHVDSQRLFW